jgi:hypothetical protein
LKDIQSGKFVISRLDLRVRRFASIGRQAAETIGHAAIRRGSIVRFVAGAPTQLGWLCIQEGALSVFISNGSDFTTCMKKDYLSSLQQNNITGRIFSGVTSKRRRNENDSS